MNSTSVNNSISDGNVSDSDDDGPPPLPPPRFDSLKGQNGAPLDRPLPNIPNSTSLNDFCCGDDEVCINLKCLNFTINQNHPDAKFILFFIHLSIYSGLYFLVKMLLILNSVIYHEPNSIVTINVKQLI